jgi:predicted nucleotidyltransferase
MQLDGVRSALQEVAREVAVLTPSSRWYLFGSVTRGKKVPSDVDLLIVYEQQSDPVCIRIALSDLMLSMPIHILFMHQEEERELDGVATQRAVLIYPT